MSFPTRYWHTLPDGRVQCDVCPRACKLREGQRGLCGALVIGRDGYRLEEWGLAEDGSCDACGTRIPGVFAGPPGGWGPRRLPVRLAGA